MEPTELQKNLKLDRFGIIIDEKDGSHTITDPVSKTPYIIFDPSTQLKEKSKINKQKIYVI
ncbi:MAG: hypothetical protein IB618_00100 [Candidatus Pacearchaeota archaeon]|nr:MAG: hypothetical protein IB618_00100 [Candidatus Pacearchaeota archaeon]